MKFLKPVFFLFTIAIFFASCKKEQTDSIDKSMGAIRGSVNTYDEYASIVYNERNGIKLDIVNDFQSFSTTTDLAGDYNIASVANQLYTFKYGKSGFVTYIQRNVNIDFENSNFPISAGVMSLPITNMYKKINWSIGELSGSTIQTIVGIDTLYDVKINANLVPAPSQATQFAGFRVFIATNDSVSKANFIWQKHYTTNTGNFEVVIKESEWRSLGLTPSNQIFVRIYGDIKPDISYLNDAGDLIYPGTTETGSSVVTVDLD